MSKSCKVVSFDDMVFQLIDDGIETAGEIASELECSPSAVSKAAKRLFMQSRIAIDKRRYKVAS